jgi:hypothetical protein
VLVGECPGLDVGVVEAASESCARRRPDRAWPLGCSDGRCPFVSLVALLTWRDLLFRAKHLFVAAIGPFTPMGRATEPSPLLFYLAGGPMDPVSRLQMARDEINRIFGVGFAERHPELVATVLAAVSQHRPGVRWPLDDGVVSAFDTMVLRIISD